MSREDLINQELYKEMDKAITGEVHKALAQVAVGKLIEITRYCDYRKANSGICRDILKIITGKDVS